MTYRDIPYVLAIGGLSIAALNLTLIATLWPHWRGWGAVSFVAGPMAGVLVITLGFIGYELIQLIRGV